MNAQAVKKIVAVAGVSLYGVKLLFGLKVFLFTAGVLLVTPVVLGYLGLFAFTCLGLVGMKDRGANSL